MKNSAPNEDIQPSTEQLEATQKNPQDINVTDDSILDLSDVLEVAVDLVSSFFDD